MRRLLCGLLLVVVGCHKETKGPAPAPAPAPKEADALWALEPAGTKLGMVITPRAVRMIEHAWQDIHAFIAKSPELAPIATQLDAALAPLGGDVSLAALGLSPDKGVAYFMVDEKHTLLVLPVGDRDRFVARVHGTRGATLDQIPELVCKPVRDLYACGETEQVIDTMGTSKTPPAFDARGDIEAFAEGVPGMKVQRLATVLELERGGFVAHGTVRGVPPLIAKLLGPAGPVTIDRDHTAAFLAMNVAGIKDLAPPIEIGAGVTLAALAQSFAGPAILTVPGGTLAFDIRLPVTDPAPARTLIDHCADLLPPALAAHVQDGACEIPLPLLSTAFAAWIEDRTLRIGMRKPPKPSAVALTPFAADLARGSWNAAMWGRGSLLAAPMTNLPAALFGSPEATMAMKFILMVSELGVGARLDGDTVHYVAVVRTAWSNPDDVVARMAAFPIADLLAGKGPERASAIAGTSSPLAADVQAGYTGLALPLGILGAIAIPAVMDSMKKTKQPTVAIDLNRLAKALKTTYAETGQFPKGDAPLTPAGGCCGPNLHCSGVPADWAKGPWKALDFTPSEPALFMFRYHSDGKTAQVDAVGDLDCDGISITYKLKASVGADGNPTMAIEAPPPNTD